MNDINKFDSIVDDVWVAVALLHGSPARMLDLNLLGKRIELGKFRQNLCGTWPYIAEWSDTAMESLHRRYSEWCVTEEWKRNGVDEMLKAEGL